MIIDNFTYNFEYKVSPTGEIKREGEKFETIELDTINNLLTVSTKHSKKEFDVEGYQIVRASNEGEFFKVKRKEFPDFLETFKKMLQRCKKYPNEVYGLFANHENGSVLLLRVVVTDSTIEVYSKDKLLFSVIEDNIKNGKDYGESKLDELFPILLKH